MEEAGKGTLSTRGHKGVSWHSPVLSSTQWTRRAAMAQVRMETRHEGLRCHQVCPPDQERLERRVRGLWNVWQRGK